MRVDIIKQKGQNVADFPIGIIHANCKEDALYLKDICKEVIFICKDEISIKENIPKLLLININVHSYYLQEN